MVRERKDIIASLKKKGFKEDKSNHKYYIYYHPDGTKSIVKTMVSHGSDAKTLDDYLLKKMAGQVKLTKPKFLELVDCTMDQNEYESTAFPEKAKGSDEPKTGNAASASAANAR